MTARRSSATLVIVAVIALSCGIAGWRSGDAGRASTATSTAAPAACPVTYRGAAPWVPAQHSSIDRASTLVPRKPPCYSSGPPDVVSVLTFCRPAVSNASLQADSAGAVLPVLRSMLRS